MEQQHYADVFDALASSPGEAANLKARADLLQALRVEIGHWNLTQTAASQRLGITRPRLNDLLRGKIDKFSLDALVNLSASAGLTLTITVGQAA